MSIEKTNEAKAIVMIDMDAIFDRFEKQAKSNRKLTFALFACASYIAVKHFAGKELTKQFKTLKKELEELKEKKGE